MPEEFELPAVSLVSYIELNSPFYPRFSKEDMMKYLHYFEMDLEVELGRVVHGTEEKSLYELCFGYQHLTVIDGRADQRS